MITRDYTDDNGVYRRVLLPDEYSFPSEGIPVSLPLEKLFSHMPPEFIAELSKALWNRGLVEPSDFFKPGAAELTRSALMDVLKHDALSIISLAKSEMK